MKTGRPRVTETPPVIAGSSPRVLDPDKVYGLAALGCTQVEMALFFGVSEKTFKRRLQEPAFREAYEQGFVQPRISVRSNLLAMSKHNAAAAIFLAKNMCGMSDHGPVELKVNRNGFSLTAGGAGVGEMLSLLASLPPPTDEDARTLEAELVELREQAEDA